MLKHFSKKYGNKERAFNYLQSESYVKMPVSACTVKKSGVMVHHYHGFLGHFHYYVGVT